VERGPLVVAAIGSFSVAALHIGIILAGAPAYRWFGAGERMARAAETGDLRPALLTLGLTLLFTLWGWYALSGAGIGPRLPWLRPALFLIAAIYLGRGVVLVRELYALLSGNDRWPLRYLGFSLTSLLIGMAYAVGFLRLPAAP